MAYTITEDSATISTSEYSLPADTTTGVPTSQTDDCGVSIHLGLQNLAAGDQFRLRAYEKAHSSATQRKFAEWILSGAQDDFVTPMFNVGIAWDFTLLRLAGSDRTIYWSIRKWTA